MIVVEDKNNAQVYQLIAADGLVRLGLITGRNLIVSDPFRLMTFYKDVFKILNESEKNLKFKFQAPPYLDYLITKTPHKIIFDTILSIPLTTFTIAGETIKESRVKNKELNLRWSQKKPLGVLFNSLYFVDPSKNIENVRSEVIKNNYPGIFVDSEVLADKEKVKNLIEFVDRVEIALFFSLRKSTVEYFKDFPQILKEHKDVRIVFILEEELDLANLDSLFLYENTFFALPTFDFDFFQKFLKFAYEKYKDNFSNHLFFATYYPHNAAKNVADVLLYLFKTLLKPTRLIHLQRILYYTIRDILKAFGPNWGDLEKTKLIAVKNSPSTQNTIKNYMTYYLSDLSKLLVEYVRFYKGKTDKDLVLTMTLVGPEKRYPVLFHISDDKILFASLSSKTATRIRNHTVEQFFKMLSGILVENVKNHDFSLKLLNMARTLGETKATNILRFIGFTVSIFPKNANFVFMEYSTMALYHIEELDTITLYYPRKNTYYAANVKTSTLCDPREIKIPENLYALWDLDPDAFVIIDKYDRPLSLAKDLTLLVLERESGKLEKAIEKIKETETANLIKKQLNERIVGRGMRLKLNIGNEVKTFYISKVNRRLSDELYISYQSELTDISVEPANALLPLNIVIALETSVEMAPSDVGTGDLATLLKTKESVIDRRTAALVTISYIMRTIREVFYNLKYLSAATFSDSTNIIQLKSKGGKLSYFIPFFDRNQDLKLSALSNYLAFKTQLLEGDINYEKLFDGLNVLLQKTKHPTLFLIFSSGKCKGDPGKSREELKSLVEKYPNAGYLFIAFGKEANLEFLTSLASFENSEFIILDKVDLEVLKKWLVNTSLRLTHKFLGEYLVE